MNNQQFLAHMAKDKSDTKTVGEVLDTLTKEQRDVVNFLLYKALTIGKDSSKDEK